MRVAKPTLCPACLKCRRPGRWDRGDSSQRTRIGRTRCDGPKDTPKMA